MSYSETEVATRLGQPVTVSVTGQHERVLAEQISCQHQLSAETELGSIREQLRNNPRI
jgi:hypothetical protein